MNKLFLINTGATFGKTNNERPVARTHNSGFEKLAVQCLNQGQFSNQTFEQVDSFVLRNPPERKARKR